MRNNVIMEHNSFNKLNKIILENTNDLVFILKKNLEIEFINKKQCKQKLGYNRNELIGKKLIEIIKTTDLKNGNKTESLHKNIDGIKRLNIKRKDGVYRSFSVQMKKFYDINEEERLILIANNLIFNGNKSLEIDKLRKILQSSPHCFFYKDLKGRYLIANKKTLSFFGISEEDLIGKSELEFLSDKELALKLIEQDQEIFKTRSSKKLIISKKNTNGIKEL
ncbi:MAG: PAS domain-containing protein, partial [Promethearchaeota archaeon]